MINEHEQRICEVLFTMIMSRLSILLGFLTVTAPSDPLLSMVPGSRLGPPVAVTVRVPYRDHGPTRDHC